MASGPSDSERGMTPLFSVRGLVAVVTGGGTGIGRMITQALIRHGAVRVYILGRRLETLRETAADLGGSIIPIQCDVTSKTDIQRAVDIIEKDIGYTDLLVCNAGINGPYCDPVTESTTLEEFAESNLDVDFDAYTRTFAVNVTAVWFNSMAFLKLLDKGNEIGLLQQKSQIIVVSSMASFSKKPTAGFAYGQSKTAATQLMKHLACYLPQWGIRANGILPGMFPSEMLSPVLERFNVLGGEHGNIPMTTVPLQRLGNEDDMAGAILYLASRAGAYCNGLALLLDGGRLNNFPSTF